MAGESLDVKLSGRRDSDSATPRHWPHAKEFTRKRQLRRLIRAVSGRWLLTVILCVALAGTLIASSREAGLTTTQKRVFNAGFLILSLMLGENVVASLKVLARILRWRIMARSPRPLVELDQILNFESFWNVLKLAQHAVSWKFRFFCLVWLILAIAYQAAIALLGINYTMHDGIIWSKNPEQAIITDFSAFFGAVPESLDRGLRVSRPEETPPLSVQQALANSFGLMGTGIPMIPTDITDRTTGANRLWQLARPEYYVRREETGTLSYIYFPQVQNPDFSYSGLYYLSLPSDRHVEVGSECISYNATTTAGVNNNITIQDGDSPRTVFVPEILPESKTVFHDPSQGCGSRCSTIMGYEPSSGDAGAFFYRCNITMTPVKGATKSQEEIPDAIAELATAAYALRGYGYTENDVQYQIYPEGTGWGIFSDGYPARFGAFCALFATYTILVMDRANPVFYVDTPRPEQGAILDVRWHFIAAIMITIVGTQFLLSMIVVIWGNSAVVLDESFLPISRLLQSVTGPLSRHGGCMLKGNEVAEVYRRTGEVSRRDVVYGICAVQAKAGGTVHLLDIADDIEPRKGAFPDGLYDGPIS